MLPSISRRLGLAATLALLVALFSIDAAYGQVGPKPPFGPGGPGNNPTNNNPFEHQYRCMKCGATFTSSAIGGPSHCPSCGVKFINGGFDPLGAPVGGRGPTAKGVGTSFLIVLGVIGVLGLLLLVGVGALIVFLIVRANRQPAVAGPPARLRPRLVDDGYDA
jgi:DNA-directed RNA polymerase subunit RPC12/RpoP